MKKYYKIIWKENDRSGSYNVDRIDKCDVTLYMTTESKVYIFDVENRNWKKCKTKSMNVFYNMEKEIKEIKEIDEDEVFLLML